MSTAPLVPTPGPARAAGHRRLLLLVLILGLALGLRLFGIEFGLPNHEHAYPYNPDEWTPMQVLRGMDPGRLDFNPHYFFNPTFHYYQYAALFAAAHLSGWINLLGDESYYFNHPESIARMIFLGRILSAVYAVLTVWLVARLARGLGFPRGAGLLSAFLLAVFPTHVIHGHFMTVNAAVTFWVVLALHLMVRWLRKGGAAPAALAGLAVGLAVSTKFSALLLVPLAALAALLMLRGRPAGRVLGESLLLAAAALGGFVAGTPYSLLAFPEFWAGFREMTTYFGGDPGAGALLAGIGKALRMYLYAATPGLLLAGILGMGLLFPGRRPGRLLVLAWMAAFLASTLKAGALASDSRFLPVVPFLALTAALLFTELRGRLPRAGAALLAATLVPVALADQAYLARFTGPQPQQLASRWAAENLRGEELIHLAGTAIYYFPDLPLRERLAEVNPGAYRRKTRWRFVDAGGYAPARAAEPDVVFLTVWQLRKPAEMEWLTDPAYEVVATFPGKVRLFGKRWLTPLDLYDTDTWVLRRRAGAP